MLFLPSNEKKNCLLQAKKKAGTFSLLQVKKAWVQG
jgi:hypothetical protein